VNFFKSLPAGGGQSFHVWLNGREGGLPTFIFIFKGTVSRDFRPSAFFIKQYTPWAPDSRAKALLNYASNSPRYDRFSKAKIVHAVSMTLHARKFFVR
jgi:hypothetical protein